MGPGQYFHRLGQVAVAGAWPVPLPLQVEPDVGQLQHPRGGLAAPRPPQDAAVVVAPGEPRVQLDGLLQIGERRVQLARNLARPRTLDLLREMADEVIELHGDRAEIGSEEDPERDLEDGLVEEVKTKAGTFKAYKMERTWSGSSGGTAFRFTDVVWFAPSAKYPVKFESNRQGAKGGELSSYTLK